VIVYEVNLRVEREIAAAYASWLHTHVAQMLALPGFVGAELFEDPAANDASNVAWCCQYRLVDAAALERYLQEHAPRMRADGVARFGARFSATRRVLQPVAVPLAAPA
jgi:quinol monooxygenase YgiN